MHISTHLDPARRADLARDPNHCQVTAQAAHAALRAAQAAHPSLVAAQNRLDREESARAARALAWAKKWPPLSPQESAAFIAGLGKTPADRRVDRMTTEAVLYASRNTCDTESAAQQTMSTQRHLIELLTGAFLAANAGLVEALAAMETDAAATWAYGKVANTAEVRRLWSIEQPELFGTWQRLSQQAALTS